jgi:hypothetical protein
MKGWHNNNVMLPKRNKMREVILMPNDRLFAQKGGFDFTDISPDDPNTLDPFRHLRFWYIIDFFRKNSLTR